MTKCYSSWSLHLFISEEFSQHAEILRLGWLLKYKRLINNAWRQVWSKSFYSVSSLDVPKTRLISKSLLRGRKTSASERKKKKKLYMQMYAWEDTQVFPTHLLAAAQKHPGCPSNLTYSDDRQVSAHCLAWLSPSAGASLERRERPLQRMTQPWTWHWITPWRKEPQRPAPLFQCWSYMAKEDDGNKTTFFSFRAAAPGNISGPCV